MSKVWNGSSLTCFSSQHLAKPHTLLSAMAISLTITPHFQAHPFGTRGPYSSRHLSASQFVCGECIQLWVHPHGYTRGQRHTLGVFPCLTVLGQKSLTGLEGHLFLARPVGLWITGLLQSPPPLLGWQIDTTIANLLGVRDSHSSTHVCRAIVHMAWATNPVHLCLSSYLEIRSHTCEHRRMKWDNTRKVLSTHAWRASHNSEFLIFYTLNLIISHFHQYLLHICLSQ